MKTIILYTCYFLVLFTTVSAQNRVCNEKKLVSDFITEQSELTLNEFSIRYVINDNDTLLSIYYQPDAFVVFNRGSNGNSFLAFSFENGLEKPQLKKQEQFLSLLYSNKRQTFIKSKKASNTEPESHGPLLLSLFGQVNCHDKDGQIINVSNLYTPGHYAVGCVAITLATVLQYSQWPLCGAGNNSYTDNIGSSRGTYSADFENTYYQWDKILERYDYQESSPEQRAALGELTYQCAVAHEMDFENGGSTASVRDMPQVLSKYFKHYGEYQSNNSSSFFDMVDSMIVKNTVVPLAVSGNGYGHSVVCDGWKTDNSGQKYYHLNMGWWGSANGWYQIHNDFNAGGYSLIDGGILNIVPTPDISVTSQENTFYIEWETPVIDFSGYELQIKKGRKNWETLAELDEGNNFTTENNAESNYAFRIRMKYNDFPQIVAWSNMFVYENNITSLAEVKNDEIQFYPNPVSNKLTIENLPVNKKVNVSLFNINGQTIKTIACDGQNSAEIDVRSLIEGNYVLIVSDEEKQISHHVLVKKQQ